MSPLQAKIILKLRVFNTFITMTFLLNYFTTQDSIVPLTVIFQSRIISTLLKLVSINNYLLSHKVILLVFFSVPPGNAHDFLSAVYYITIPHVPTCPPCEGGMTLSLSL